jgi:hypothetical protein
MLCTHVCPGLKAERTITYFTVLQTVEGKCSVHKDS